jgi:ornithine--oxo-acid transaminase
MGELSALESRYGAANYKPLPVTLVRGCGVYVWDEKGRLYLDMMGAYSAASFGHCHPRLVEAMTQQAQRLDTVSRAYSPIVWDRFWRAPAS